MTTRRVLLLLAAAVLVIAGGLWLSSQRQSQASTLAGGPVLKDLKPALNDVSEVRISKGDGTLATLRKRASDWVVVERDFPADGGRVRKLLLDLGNLEIVEEKTSEAANYATLGVEDVTSATATGTKIEVVAPPRTFALIVGKPSGTKSVYVRAAGNPQSLLAAPQLTADSDPKRWIERTILDIPQDRIKQVDVKPATGPAYTVAREKKEQSDFTVSAVPKGRELSSPSAANPLAGTLAAFTLDDVRRAPANAPEATERVTYQTFDGLQLVLTGHKDGDRRYVTLAPSSTAKETAEEAQKLDAKVKGWEFEIPGYKYDSIFRPVEELLAPKPEPAKKS
jgi:FlaG/FlaF family flagellin (archaellin)